MTARLRPLAIATLMSLIAALLAAAPLTRADAATFTQAESGRVAGEDAVGTAIALAEDTYESAATVVLARVDDYADALTGSVLAAALDAPVLFTQTASLSEGVLPAVQRLGATEVVLLGGVAAVSQDVEDALRGEGLTTRRVAGDTRFTTALEVADEVTGPEGDAPATAFVVEGEHTDPTRGWPDAIGIAAVAAATGQPIIPVNAAFVPAVIQERLDAWAEAGTELVLVGGESALSPAVDEALGGELPRIAGDTRFATSAAAYAYGVSEAALDPAVRYVIPGGSFAEGLAASAIAGAAGHPTVMVDSTDIAGSPDALELLGTNVDTLERYVLVGDESVIAPEVADAIAAATTRTVPEAASCLTVLHHNDGESQLLGAPVGEDYGSLARMVTLAEQERARAEAEGCEAITVTSGDNFLAGPALTASDPTNTDPAGPPVLDSLGLSRVGYDALAIGNHDFDFGPNFLARFIGSFTTDVPFLSANLDVSPVPALDALADAGRIAPATVVGEGDARVGIVGAVTPFLRSISSPGDVVVIREVVEAVQIQVDALTADGVEQIVLISHLQGLGEDIDFVSEISGIDVVVAGGGDEVLASPADPLVPGDLENVADTYPLLLTDADGDTVPTVTTAGDYKYLGRLTVYFGEDGELLEDTPVDAQTSRMVRVADESLPGGVARDADVVAEVEAPVRDFVEGLEENVVATSEVPLEGRRPAIRQSETNLGDLIADAHRYIATTRGPEFGLDTAGQQVVGLQNGGGIRNNSEIPAGDISELTTFEILPFANFIAAVPDFTAQQLKDVLESAYASLPGENGAFAHVSGVSVTIDPTQQAQEVEVADDGTVEIVTPGERIRSMTLADGTELVVDGEVVEGAPTFILASIDFSLRNGDAYPFNLGEDGFTVLGTSYQQSLFAYLTEAADAGALAGQITAEQYPVGGDGRITILPAD